MLSMCRLANWVTTQQVEYKRKKEKGDGASSLTKDRIERLDDIGFTWDVLEDFWESRFDELVEYKHTRGNCRVPRHFPINKR